MFIMIFVQLFEHHLFWRDAIPGLQTSERPDDDFPALYLRYGRQLAVGVNGNRILGSRKQRLIGDMVAIRPG